MNGETLLKELAAEAAQAQARFESMRSAQAKARTSLEAELHQLDMQLQPFEDMAETARKKLICTKRAMLGPWIPYSKADHIIDGQRLLHGASKPDGWNCRAWLRKVGQYRALNTTHAEWIWQADIGPLTDERVKIVSFGPGSGDNHADFVRLSKIVDNHLTELGWILCD